MTQPSGFGGSAGITVAVGEEIHVAEARRAARTLAQSLWFGTAGTYYLATVATELGTNLLRHAGGGTLSFTALGEDRPGLEILAEDSGPGMEDIALCLKEGYSSNGGLGGGLPGVKRLVDEFEIESTPGRGTRIRVRKWL